MQSKKGKSKKERRNKRGLTESGELKRSELSSEKDEFGESESVEESTSGGGEVCGGGGDAEEEEEFEKGSVRKFVSFIGERIWGVWT